MFLNVLDLALLTGCVSAYSWLSCYLVLLDYLCFDGVAAFISGLGIGYSLLVFMFDSDIRFALLWF